MCLPGFGSSTPYQPYANDPLPTQKEDIMYAAMTDTTVGCAKLAQWRTPSDLGSCLIVLSAALSLFSCQLLIGKCDFGRQAAEGGDPDAHAHLGHMYANGVGVDQNNETARRYFQAAANAGNPNGQFGLGYMHLTGQPVEQDHGTAFKLFQHASEAVSRCFWLAAPLLVAALLMVEEGKCLLYL